jgi:hypothetical protein
MKIRRRGFDLFNGRPPPNHLCAAQLGAGRQSDCLAINYVPSIATLADASVFADRLYPLQRPLHTMFAAPAQATEHCKLARLPARPNVLT